MKMIFTVLVSFIALVFTSFVIKKDEPLYKNLKVLSKKTTKAEMDTLMRHFARSLGKKCNHCHVFNEEQKKMDFASDAKKEKDIAREMWLMTAKLNKKYFDIKDSKRIETKLQVTCYTCHRGAAEPETQTPIVRVGLPREGHSPAMAVSAR